MVHIPTTDRKFYDNLTKVDSLGLTTSALMPAVKDMQKTFMQQQQIKIDTNSTKARVEIDEFTNQWRLNNQANPNNQEARKEWQNGVQEILNKYGSEIDPIAGQSWNLTATKLTESYNQGLNQWALAQNAENVKLDIADNININLQRAYSAGQNGNIEQAIQDLDISFGQLEGYGVSSLGATNTKALLKDYKKNYIKNFIAGQMMTDPQSALESINNEQIQGVFDGKGEVDELKGFALSKLAVAKQYAEVNAIMTDVKNSNDLLNRSLQGNLSIEEIQSLMPKDASASYKSLIYQFNGYSTKGLNKAGGTSGKVEADDKALAEAEVYEDFMQISGSKGSAKDKVDAFKKLNEKIYKYMETGHLSAEKGTSLLNDIAAPLSKEWQEYGEEYAVDREGFWQGNYGLEDLLDGIELPKVKDKKSSTGKKQLAANARVKNDISQLYFNNLQAELIKEGYSLDRIKELNNDIVKKRKIFSTAQDKTMSDYNSGKYRELLKLTPEQQPNQVLDNGELVNNSGNIDNSNQGKPITDGNWTKVGNYQVRIK